MRNQAYGAKFNLSLLRRLQSAKILAQKAGTSKNTSKISTADARKKRCLSGAGAKYYLCYLKEGRERSPRKDNSTTVPRKRGAAKVSPQERNAPKKPKSRPNRKGIPGRLEVKRGARRPAASAMKSIRLAISEPSFTRKYRNHRGLMSWKERDLGIKRKFD